MSRPVYAFLGPEGTFTEAALRQVVSPDDGDYRPVGSVITALAQVRAGEAQFAVVPIENSVEGGVTATLDDIAGDEGLQIVREVLVPISFVLVGRTEMDLEEITSVSTHSHGWAQVRNWAAKHLPNAEFIPASSTAAGARGLLDPETHYQAAVCSPLVAEQVGLPVLAQAIEDTAGAVTRFVVVSQPGPIGEPTGSDKTTVVVPLPEDRPGALMEILDQFSTRGINLSRIESRPTGAGLGSYFFSIDLEGHLAEERVSAALAALYRLIPGVRFLGSYPRADQRRYQVPEHTTDAAYHSGQAWVTELLGRSGT
ncbi:prephenate dehydratase [Citricoccus muralis]|uniref:Prephenate dehydratase n=1 Tax=Citricoccus muralis TaxID=169134 RepID=A0ABY8H6H7_9MICC|nr:prephenate dehydratase [Citricoccus muralis]WFP16747.1 prephenate dehydratase [Citricoccus muralis]